MILSPSSSYRVKNYITAKGQGRKEISNNRPGCSSDDVVVYQARRMVSELSSSTTSKVTKSRTSPLDHCLLLTHFPFLPSLFPACSNKPQLQTEASKHNITSVTMACDKMTENCKSKNCFLQYLNNISTITCQM